MPCQAYVLLRDVRRRNAALPCGCFPRPVPAPSTASYSLLAELWTRVRERTISHAPIRGPCLRGWPHVGVLDRGTPHSGLVFSPNRATCGPPRSSLTSAVTLATSSPQLSSSPGEFSIFVMRRVLRIRTVFRHAASPARSAPDDVPPPRWRSVRRVCCCVP